MYIFDNVEKSGATMKILITGGTGFIGRQLVNALSADNDITILTRSAGKAHLELGRQHRLLGNLSALSSLDGFDAVINLAGEPIADKRWTLEQKQKICHSRWDITARLSQLFNASQHPPSVFISGSAIGIYGNHDDHTLIDETFDLAQHNDASHTDFAHRVCTRWEALALEAANSTRVCIVRIGLVLGLNGGALKKMLLPFKMGGGGIIGSGKQGMSWIHQADLVGLILFLLHNDKCSGIFNGTAPNPVSNKDFTKALGKALHRPTFLPMPAMALNIALGELSQLLLEGQYVYPNRALEAGYQFTYPQLSEALAALMQNQ